MVRTSDRQLALEAAAKLLTQASFLSEVINALDSSDSSDSDSDSGDSSDSDGDFDLDDDVDADPYGDDTFDTLSDFFIDLASCRYVNPRTPLPKRERLIAILARYRNEHPKRFRSLVRMQPEGFENLVQFLRSEPPFVNHTGAWSASRIAVALYRLGRSGNAASVRDVALSCGCSEGAVVNYTSWTVRALANVADRVVTPATELERRLAKAWVYDRVGCEEWTKGWLVVDGTHIEFAARPGLNTRQCFNYKHAYSMNVALVILPHSLRIVEFVIGFYGHAQDSRVWAGGSRILQQPRLYLDEDEFIWNDGGYGYSFFGQGPYSAAAGEHSKDFRRFNYRLSAIRTRVEHAIGFLKNRFQCLKGIRNNVYRESDFEEVSRTITACIVAHTFASWFDEPQEVTDYLPPRLAAEFEGITFGDEAPDPDVEAAAKERRRQAQERYAAALRIAMRDPKRFKQSRTKAALRRRERLHTALFRAAGYKFTNTTRASRRCELTTKALIRRNRAAESRRQLRNLQRNSQRRASRAASRTPASSQQATQS